MLKEFVDRILELKRDVIVKVDDRDYATHPVTGVVPPLADRLELHTLSGLVDYIREEGAELGGKLVHVVSPERVVVWSELHDMWRKRESFAVAEMVPYHGFAFNQFMEIEQAIIELQSKFVATPHRTDLIVEVSRINSNIVIAAEDDGVCQTVIAKDAIGRNAEKKMDPIVSLAPYRTFREVEQPVSKFLARFKSAGEGRLPTVALFEADGGAWQNDAIDNIAQFLRDKLPEELQEKGDVTVIS